MTKTVMALVASILISSNAFAAPRSCVSVCKQITGYGVEHLDEIKELARQWDDVSGAAGLPVRAVTSSVVINMTRHHSDFGDHPGINIPAARLIPSKCLPKHIPSYGAEMYWIAVLAVCMRGTPDADHLLATCQDNPSK